MAIKQSPSVGVVMRRLARAIECMDNPAIEKLAAEQKGDSFQVLIANAVVCTNERRRNP
ncbi:MAG: hypothetical protein Ct9H300mP25_07370 [Acidobacteriota bacterium]|nr:MAG: hypothetical protein Ct9H300mP25_07370 [Acidobacteriota bacterium]